MGVLLMLFWVVNTGNSSASATARLLFIFPDKDSVYQYHEEDFIDSLSSDVDTMKTVRVYVDSVYFEIKLREDTPDSLIADICEGILYEILNEADSLYMDLKQGISLINVNPIHAR